MLDIRDTVQNWLTENRKIALATVVETWGSAPRQAGAKMAIAQDMSMIGSVSGGCVEGAVVEEALASLKTGKPKLLTFGVTDDIAWDVGLACGGKISIYVEPLNASWWRNAVQCTREDKPFVSVTQIAGETIGTKILATASEILYPTMTAQLIPGQQRIISQALESLTKRQKSARIKIDENEIFVDTQLPRPQLIIIGGAHVAMALKDLAHQQGFRVTLIDPREAFATEERFPDVEMISHLYPDKVLPTLGLTEDTYIAILTHDPKIDDPALRVALPSAARYIGILSSKRTHDERVKRLTEAGIETRLMERIRTPIGIEIGAQTPEEIALCIMAEIIATKNGVLPTR